jgi:hypothetical protein
MFLNDGTMCDVVRRLHDAFVRRWTAVALCVCDGHKITKGVERTFFYSCALQCVAVRACFSASRIFPMLQRLE